MIEPRSIQSQWCHMLAPLTTRPQQHLCNRDENQLLKSCIKFRYYKFLERLPEPRDEASKMRLPDPRDEVYNFINSLIKSPNLKFLVLVDSKFLINLAFKK